MELSQALPPACWSGVSPESGSLAKEGKQAKGTENHGPAAGLATLDVGKGKIEEAIFT